MNVVTAVVIINNEMVDIIKGKTHLPRDSTSVQSFLILLVTFTGLNVSVAKLLCSFVSAIFSVCRYSVSFIYDSIDDGSDTTPTSVCTFV